MQHDDQHPDDRAASPRPMAGSSDGPGAPVDGLARLLFALMIVAGLWLRAQAIEWNRHPHGDVHLDAITLGELAAGNGFTTPLVRAAEYRDSLGAQSYPLDQHPPLAILLGLALHPLAGDAYRAMQYGSFLASLALLVGVFLLTRRLLDADRALFVTAACAGSFALADFAGNGAVYSLHAALAVFALLSLSRRHAIGGAITGALLGLAYLTNYQALVFLPAAVFAIVVSEGRATFERAGMLRLLGLALGFALVCSPWWWRNVSVFGDPTYSVNPFYLKWKLGGIPSVTETAETTLFSSNGRTIAPGDGQPIENIVVNVRFIATQSTLWLAVLLPLALIAVPSWVRFSRSRRDVVPLAILAFVCAHLAVMALWPGCKFRYFVPLIPLLAVLAAQPLGQATTRVGTFLGWLVAGGIAIVAAQMLIGGRADDGAITLAALALAWAAATLQRFAAKRALKVSCAFVAVQVVLFCAAETRTAYYDAILIRDQFRERGTETRDRARQDDLARIPAELGKRGIRAIAGDVELEYHAAANGVELIVIQPPALGDPAIDGRALGKAMRRHGATYLLALDEETRAAYSTFPGYQDSEPLLEGRAHLLRFSPP